MTDNEIDMSDSPELTDDFFREATWRRGTPITLEIDPDLLPWMQGHLP